mgnify:CR=1 FL=1
MFVGILEVDLLLPGDVRSLKDKRGHVLHITEAGRKARKACWPHYAKAINRHVGDKLSETEAEKLAALLGKLLAD